MNTLFAAGLFDSPWIVAALIVGSALVNWLSKRRQEKQEAGKPPEGEEPSPRSGPPAGEFDLEEILRRLTGEKPSPPTPAPPLIPRPPQRELPPVQTGWAEEPLPPERTRQPASHTAPDLRPFVAAAQASVTSPATSQEVEQAERRFEQLREQAEHPATVVSHIRQRPSRPGSRGVARWRNPRSVRQAFVASLVFAPPKSLEP